MLTHADGLILTAAVGGRHGLLGGHGWHTIEALGFLITSLGGIAIAEFVQARQRRTRSVSRYSETPQRQMSTVRGGSAVALLPARTEIERSTEHAIETAVGRRAVLLPLVALAGAAAAAVHFVVMPEHFEEATLYGAFFAIAATSQLLYSVLLLARPSRILLAAGGLGNLTIVVLWLVTRTIGIPLGPGAGDVESVGGLDVLATIFEVTTVVGAALLMLQRRPLVRALRPSTWSPLIWALGSSAALAIAVTAYLSPPS